jgi:CheY-like chemotaxis protein
MIRVCCYKGCEVVYGEKEPLSDKSQIYGLCPIHFEVSIKEVMARLEKFQDNASPFKVLIVEDSSLLRQLLRGMLKERFPFIRIVEATDGKEALQKVSEFSPDLIFMDIRLPGVNGLELTKRIKAQYPNIIVVILTGYDLPEYRDASRQYADYFFSKDSSTTENIIELVRLIVLIRS